jgi:hypothetical protein
MAFIYRLEDEAGEPVEPHTFKTAVPNWKAGDTIPLPGPTREDWEKAGEPRRSLLSRLLGR